MTNTGEFFNKSSYLLGFLAALIGLAAFKDSLASIWIEVFSVSFTLLDAAVPMVLVMLLAAYLSALAQFLSNVTFTKIPISRYLNISSNAVSILALIYPVLFVVLLGGARLFELLSSNIEVLGDKALYFTAIVSVLVAIITSLKSAININKARQENDLAHAFDRINDISLSYKNSDKGAHLFLQKYEKLVETIVRYLKLRGYGVGGRGLLNLSRILYSKDVFSAEDVDHAATLNKLRNAYAHGQKDLTPKELDDSLDKLMNLQNKAVEALYRLNPGGSESSES